VGSADLLLGLVCRGENVLFQMGVMSPGTLGEKKASYSELVLFGPSKIFLLASMCHASRREEVDTSKRGSLEQRAFKGMLASVPCERGV